MGPLYQTVTIDGIGAMTEWQLAGENWSPWS